MAAIAEGGLQPGDKVLITCVDGFAGSHLAKHLLAEGYAVKGIVAEKSDDESFSHFVPEGVDEAMLEVRQINLFSTSESESTGDDDTEIGPIVKEMEGCKAVCHMLPTSAALYPAFGSKFDLAEAPRNSTVKLLNACKRTETISTLLLMSDMSTVTEKWEPANKDEQKKTFRKDDWNETVTAASNPFVYGLKVNEKHALAKAAEGKLRVISLCSGVMFGPSNNLRGTIRQARLSDGVTFLQSLLNGDIGATYNLSFPFIDVRDVAKVVLSMLQKKDASGRFLCAKGIMEMADLCKLCTANFPDYPMPSAGFAAGASLSAMSQNAGTKALMQRYLDQAPLYENETFKATAAIEFTEEKQTVHDAILDLVDKRCVRLLAPIIVEDTFARISVMAQAKEGGVSIKDRMYWGATYPQCFKGSEFCDWLIENATDHGVSSRPDAVGMAQKMLRDGAIKVQGNQASGFEDKPGSWYAFRKIRKGQLERLGLQGEGVEGVEK